MIIDKLTLGIFQTNTYFLTEGNETMIVDPGERYSKIESFIREKGLNPVGIVGTHAHLDHIASAAPLMNAFRIPCFLHKKERAILKALKVMCEQFHMPYHGEPHPVAWIGGGKPVCAGVFNLEWRLTPGHTPGGISILTDAGVLCGDTIFYRSVGRSDFPGGDAKTLMESIRTQIFTLPDETVLYPGHGLATTVGYEKKHNPFTAGL
jgi:hydroxyacylglutathione hydrolase